MSMKTILITGGAGFIGSNLCHYLLEKGNKVIVIDNFITSDGSNIAAFSTNKNFTFIRHDIAQPFPKRMIKKLSSVTHIYHLACPTGVPNIEILGKEMLYTCTLGTIHVLELAKANNARVLFSSSSEVYGEPQVFPQSEEYTGNVDPLGPRSPYEEGKRVSESLIHYAVKKEGVDAVMVRIFNTYGPGMAKTDTRVVPYFFSCIKSHKPLQIHGDGTQTRTFCYVDDLVAGLELVMTKGKKGEVYNIGSELSLSIVTLASYIQSLTGTFEEIRFVRRPAHDHTHRIPDLKKINRLGWHETVDLIEGLERTRVWYG